MPPDIQTYYLTQGVLGATVVVLMLVLGYIYMSREKERTKHVAEIAALNATMAAVAEARRVETKQDTEKLIEVVRTNSQNMELMASKIEVGKNFERAQR